MASAKLQHLIAEPQTQDDPKTIIEALGAAISDVESIIAGLKHGREPS